MPEKETKDETKNTPQPLDRSVKRGQVKVRVIGKQPLSEAGNVYHPARKEAGKQIPADTFFTSPNRAEALGEHVEVLEEANAE